MSGGTGAPGFAGDVTRERRRAADNTISALWKRIRGGDVSGDVVRSGAPLLALCVLLGGCAALQPPAEPEAPVQPVPEQVAREPRRPSDAEHLLAYYAQLRKISGSELAREHEAARQAYGSARSDYNRVRLAMIMTLPNTPYYDEPRALDVLDPLARSPGAPLSGLALLLASQIQERKRLDATAHALQQKLDALKSLERSLNERKR